MYVCIKYMYIKDADHARVVDHLLERPHGQGTPADVLHLVPFFLVLLLVGLEDLLVPNKFLFHEQVIFDPFELEQSQLALGRRVDFRELARRARAAVPPSPPTSM